MGKRVKGFSQGPFIIFKWKLATRMQNYQKAMWVTAGAGLLALILDAIMFVQHGQSLTAPAVWGRLLVFVVLVGIVCGLAVLKMRFCGYATILVNLYFAIASLGAFQMVSPRQSIYGLFVQALSIIGILVGAAGIYYGIKQRSDYTKAKIEQLEERMKNENNGWGLSGPANKW